MVALTRCRRLVLKGVLTKRTGEINSTDIYNLLFERFLKQPQIMWFFFQDIIKQELVPGIKPAGVKLHHHARYLARVCNKPESAGLAIERALASDGMSS
jgi:hypothetical protein